MRLVQRFRLGTGPTLTPSPRSGRLHKSGLTLRVFSRPLRGLDESSRTDPTDESVAYSHSVRFADAEIDFAASAGSVWRNCCVEPLTLIRADAFAGGAAESPFLKQRSERLKKELFGLTRIRLIMTLEWHRFVPIALSVHRRKALVDFPGVG
jgi:hypothetical protein